MPLFSHAEDKHSEADAAASDASPLLKNKESGASAPSNAEGASPKNSFDELSHWQCGQQRLHLRQEMNTKELDAAALIKKYDADGSKVLEIEELKHLLQDYNEGVRVKTDDVSFIMRVADKNHDDVISQSEVLAALRAWYAYRNFPTSVGTAISRFDIGKGPMPSDTTIRELLLTLNESQPVSDAEVEFVKAQLIAVGGRPDKVTHEDMRKALAPWYLHIERPATSDAQLVAHGFGKLHTTFRNLDVIRRWREGDIDCSARGTRIFLAVVVGVFLFFPSLALLVARAFPSDYQCEHPHLSVSLWWTGLAGLAQVTTFFLACVVHYMLPENMTAVVTTWCIFGTFTVIVIAMNTHGFFQVLSCSSYRCGFVLWHYAHFLWVMVPMYFLIFVCFIIPCIYCLLGKDEFHRSKDLDDSLVSKPSKK